MIQTTYRIEQMDCAAEEQMVRMQLEGTDGVRHLVFDLSARLLTVYHSGESANITAALEELGLGVTKISQKEESASLSAVGHVEDAEDRRPLAAALAINAAFFVGEITAGFLAGSMGLVADSLDMLADSLVYALSLAAAGGPMVRKTRLARYSGYLQFALAIFGLAEVVRRFMMGDGVPDVTTMVVVAALAMVGNVATLVILNRARRGEAHVEASWIFTSNDIKVNGLVILSGLLVWTTASRIPDLLAGALIFLIVARGARQILALSSPPPHARGQ